VNKSDLIAKMTERLSGDRPMAVAAVNGVRFSQRIGRSALVKTSAAAVMAPMR
jgi:hypothetical protein